MRKLLSICVCLLVLAPVFISCSKDSDDSDFTSEFKLVLESGTTRADSINNLIKDPTWLADIVKSMGEQYKLSPATGEYPYPSVYQFEYKSTSYIWVSDLLNNCHSCGNRFFTENGKEITYSSDKTLYDELDSYSGKTSHCIWSILKK